MKNQSKNLSLSDCENETQELLVMAQHFPVLNMDFVKVAVNLEKTAKFTLKAVEMPFSELGCSRVGFFILMCLKLEPPVQQASEIAKRWGVKKEAVRKPIETLEKAGYVRKENDPNDGRAHKIIITNEGEQFWENALNKYSKWLSETFGGLNKDEQEQVIQCTLKTKDLFS